MTRTTPELLEKGENYVDHCGECIGSTLVSLKVKDNKFSRKWYRAVNSLCSLDNIYTGADLSNTEPRARIKP
ncbi:hypothetical protein AVEN_41463-1 [Araneus ventricosus]|uniref:Uncharacterized protein n=1 Tax=Araneus ventricosus TaxID=182803 RepID=A0A4Y2F3K4_ARAVE|nr:hypothetical protein AVEN_41463-1 [Araneus ventricosus]